MTFELADPAGLGVAPDDAADVLRTRPRPDDAERWQRPATERDRFVAGMAHNGGGAVPPACGTDSDEERLLPVHIILSVVGELRRCHQAFGIPAEVTDETVAALGPAMAAYREAHGEPGLDIGWFQWMRFSGFLFQVGRLTVTPYKLCTTPEAGPLFWLDPHDAKKRGPGFRKGDPALGLHIPSDTPLSPSACDESLARMRPTFGRRYPGEPLRVATCTSWLLDDRLAEYLPAESNIVSFQRRFELVPGVRPDDGEIARFAFGRALPADLDELPQDTTLRRAVVAHLRAGGHWGLRTGWLEI